MIDYLEAGDSIDDFLNDFPTVTRADAVAALLDDSAPLIRKDRQSR